MNTVPANWVCMDLAGPSGMRICVSHYMQLVHWCTLPLAGTANTIMILMICMLHSLHIAVADSFGMCDRCMLLAASRRSLVLLRVPGPGIWSRP